MAKGESAYVVQCDIDDTYETVLTLRNNDQWYYATATPKDIQNVEVKNEYTKLAKAAKQYQVAMQKMIFGEDQDQQDDTDQDRQEHGEVTQEDDDDDADGQPNQEDTHSKEAKTAADSGYGSVDEPVEEEDETTAEDIFQEWLQHALAAHLESSRSGDKKKEKNSSCTLSQWYRTKIDMFMLYADKDDKSLQARTRDDLDGDKFIDDSVTPGISVPKYIQEAKGVEWYSPEDIIVLDESHDIHLPVHPTRVRVTDGGAEKEVFLKLASDGDEAAVKREIKFLLELQKKDLYSKGIRAPQLEGLVAMPATPSSHDQLLGFLLTLIPQPCTPMTKLMDSDVAKSKRDRWAKQMQDMVDVLHKHDLVWGDAKGDNFVVDKSEDLWIIDFGGSFTVGWIDPENADTKKGDNQGTQRIIEGLQSPNGPTDGGEVEDGKEVGSKRKRSQRHEEAEEDQGPASKQSRRED